MADWTEIDAAVVDRASRSEVDWQDVVSVARRLNIEVSSQAANAALRRLVSCGPADDLAGTEQGLLAFRRQPERLPHRLDHLQGPEEVRTMAATTNVKRTSAGHYETTDGRVAIVHNPAGWVVYLTADPLAADSYATLADAKAAIAGGAW